ncbi:tim44-like domain-containing protein [Ditylenchus destructor]|nr:tim44-like domain-containing protein [Ditylenchus destructor]
MSTSRILSARFWAVGPFQQGSSGLFGNVALGSGTIQVRGVHHHKEWEIDKRLYLGLIRSNPAKANRNTHINERRFRKVRAQKTLVIDLPDDNEQRKIDKMDPEEVRLYYLKKGINPYKDVAPREWNEHQITYQSFYRTIDPFVNYEDSADKLVSKDTFERGKDTVKHKFYNWWRGTKRIKAKEGYEDFDVKTFPQIAESVYRSAFETLVKRDKTRLHEFVTEYAFPKLWPDVETGTVVWELQHFKEPSKVVSVRCYDMPPSSGNDIAQVTVRMHSVQKFALYDRFGRLLLGSEDEPKDCLEYVVFENHIVSTHGKWRFHDKVYPHWAKPKEGVNRKSLLDRAKSREGGPEIIRFGFDKQVVEDEKQQKEKKDRKMSDKTTENDQKRAELFKDDEDEFEEFVGDVEKAMEQEGDFNVWEDNWDDESAETDFSKQLREELAKHSYKPAQ